MAFSETKKQFFLEGESATLSRMNLPLTLTAFQYSSNKERRIETKCAKAKSLVTNIFD